MSRPNRTLDRQMRELGFVGFKEGSEKTGIPRSSLYDAAKRGLVEVREVRGRRYISIVSLLAYGDDPAAVEWKAKEAASNGSAKEEPGE